MDTIWESMKKADDLRNFKGDLQGARRLLEQLLEKSEEADAEFPIIGAKLAAIYRDSGETELSWQMHEKSLKSAQFQNNPILSADILRAMSFFAIHSKTLKEAEEYIKRAQELVDSIDSRNVYEVKATVYAVLGNIEMTKGNHDKALEYYSTALDLAKKAGYIARIVTVTGDIANVYIAQGKNKEAEKQLLSVLEDAEREYRMAVPQLHMRYAKMKIKEGDMNSAEKSLTEAMSVAKKEGWKRDQAEILETLAGTKEGKDRKKLLKESKEIFDEMGYSGHSDRVSKKMKSTS